MTTDSEYTNRSAERPAPATSNGRRKQYRRPRLRLLGDLRRATTSSGRQGPPDELFVSGSPVP